MCCFESFKRIVPFAITFAIGLFVASLFYSFADTNSSQKSSFTRYKNQSNYKKSSCNFEKRMRIEKEIEQVYEEDFFLLDTESEISPEFRNDSVERSNEDFDTKAPEAIILKEELRERRN